MEQRTLFAGPLILIGILWIIIAERLAEWLTPTYDASTTAISGLGSTFFGTYAVLPRTL